MLTADLDYDLPPDLIATEPATPRDAARLMVVDRQTGQVEHRHVRDLLGLASPTDPGNVTLEPGDLMVFNQSRVVPACFGATRMATGGEVTGLYLCSTQRSDGCYWEVLLESGGKLKAGESISLEDQSCLELVERCGEGRWLGRLHSQHDTLALLGRIGSPPLPPYIRRRRRQKNQPLADPQDPDRYNTVYAAQPGSVAAPTAGLHFTPELLDQLNQAGIRRAMVTLHVGLGTFAPVRTKILEDHPIHSEPVTISASTMAAIQGTRLQGGRIVAVGTTTVRALESLPAVLPTEEDFSTHTNLLITPETGGSLNSFPFRFTDRLMTNFHLPCSTLLAMVAALPGVGLERLMGWYKLAIQHKYRFYSYGDAMLIL